MMLGISPDTQITSCVLMGIQTTTHWVDAGVPRNEIYRGTLGDFATHSPVTCSTGGNTQAIVAAADPENRYYLVVPRSPTAEGSYGSDSSGQPRDQGAEACLPRLIAGCAP